jgi:hypothetical protein
MQMNGKQILITTESHEVLVVRRERERVTGAFCLECCELVEMLSFDTAISHSGIGGRQLMMRLETGDVHSIEAESGHLLICRRSIERIAEC